MSIFPLSDDIIIFINWIFNVESPTKMPSGQTIMQSRSKRCVVAKKDA